MTAKIQSSEKGVRLSFVYNNNVEMVFELNFGCSDYFANLNPALECKSQDRAWAKSQLEPPDPDLKPALVDWKRRRFK